MYRYERSGVMHGLLRVRGFTQDDAHIFCTPEQIENEIADCVEFARDVLKDFGFDKFRDRAFHLGPGRSSRVSSGSDEQWNMASALAGESSEATEYRIQDDSRRSRVLRAQDRHQAGGRHRPPVAALDRAVRFQPAAALRPGIRRRRRIAQAAGDGASGAVWIGRALLRRADRALCRSVSGVAVAGAGGR